jgi:hypothetical protein
MGLMVILMGVLKTQAFISQICDMHLFVYIKIYGAGKFEKTHT